MRWFFIWQHESAVVVVGLKATPTQPWFVNELDRIGYHRVTWRRRTLELQYNNLVGRGRSFQHTGWNIQSDLWSGDRPVTTDIETVYKHLALRSHTQSGN